MVNCFICNAKHDVTNFLNCNFIISLMIKNYKRKKFNDYKILTKKSKHKKYTCEKCNKVL